jgi:hypothetical protein
VEQANNFMNRKEGNTETKPTAQLLVTPLGKDEPPCKENRTQRINGTVWKFRNSANYSKKKKKKKKIVKKAQFPKNCYFERLFSVSLW